MYVCVLTPCTWTIQQHCSAEAHKFGVSKVPLIMPCALYLSLPLLHSVCVQYTLSQRYERHEDASFLGQWCLEFLTQPLQPQALTPLLLYFGVDLQHKIIHIHIHTKRTQMNTHWKWISIPHMRVCTCTSSLPKRLVQTRLCPDKSSRCMCTHTPIYKLGEKWISGWALQTALCDPFSTLPLPLSLAAPQFLILSPTTSSLTPVSQKALD